MTFKNIDFYDSPVMRNLARMAIEKGTIKPSVKSMVKQASTIEVKSGNFLIDISKLANGLRAKGFARDAESLEQKFLLFKKAEKAVYNELLEFAHPDGDVHIADAKDNNGDVETKESAHEKILSVINKSPTGKQAKLINNALESIKLAFDPIYDKDSGTKGSQPFGWADKYIEMHKNPPTANETARPVSVNPGVVKIYPDSHDGHASPSVSGPIDPAEKDHVQSMQFALLRLASYLQSRGQQVSALLNVGKGKNKAEMDGLWGPNTTNALKEASKAIAIELTAGPMMHQKGVVEAADQNTNTIVTYLSKVGGDTTGLNSTSNSAKSSSFYDVLPKNLQFSQLELQALLEHGSFPLDAATMGSLASLYRFLVEKIGVEPQTLGSNDPMQMDVRGFTVAKWDEIIKWFMMRAKTLYTSAKDSNVRQKYSAYHADAVKLWNQLIAYGKTAGLTTADMNKIIPENQLPSSGSGVDGVVGNGGAPNGVAPNGKNHPGGSENQSGVGYGGELGGYDAAEAPTADPNIPPFGEDIDLKNRYFSRVVQAFPQMKGNLIPWQDFWNWGAREFVSNFTSTKGPQNTQEAWQKALSQLGYSPTQNGWVNVDPNSGRQYVFDGKNDPRVGQLASQNMNIDPRQKAMEFLSYLGKAVNDAKNDWQGRANPARRELVNTYRWQQKWQEAIANKLEDIRNL